MPVADAAPVAPPDSRPIYRLIRRTRLLLRVTWLVTGLALTAGLLLGAASLVLAADLLLPMLQLPFYIAYPLDSGLRCAALVLAVAPPAAAFLLGVVAPLFRRLTAGRVARRIEARLPGIHNRLVSCIDLEARGRAAASPVFYRKLLTESLERIQGFRPGRVLDFVNLRRAALVAVVGALAFVAVCFVFSNRLLAAASRILQPFADLPPYAGVFYEVQPGPGAHHFLRDDKIDFVTKVQGGEVGGLRIQLQADNGAVRDFDLAPVPDDPAAFKLTLDSASIGPAFLTGFHYRVYGGGTWTPRYALPLSERPLIKAVDTAVYYPAYMGIPEPHPTPAEASEIIGPEGGDIEVSVLAEGNVAVAELQPLKAGTRKIAPHDQVERAWFEDAKPDGATDGGTWQQAKKDKRAAHTEPYAMGPHGHWFQGDPAGFTVQPGDVLFAYVHIDPQAPPDEILLQWNDGKGWDHGAYWGVDLIREGQSNTPSRYPVDKVPHAGGWVRLEVPAAKVGLEGATLHGMAFKMSGGQCWWGKSGAVRLEQPTFVADETMHAFPMKEEEPGRWVGRVPLLGKGQFRPQLRNEQGDANIDVQELHYSAIKDQPPTVVLQRPGPELALSKPQATPLTVLAYDDYGLADATVFFRDNEKDPYQSRILRHFDQPERSQTVVASLLEAEALKAGSPLHYYVQVSDRKGQTARTPDAVVYLRDDANAADKQEEAFDKTQDTFRDRLVQMIAEQKKVQANVEKVTTQYAAMTEKIRKDQEAASPKPPPAATDPTKPPPPKEAPKLDPETAKKLADLQKELAALAQQQDKNTQAASQLNNDLVKANEQAEKLQTLPQPVVDQMQSLQQAFEQTAVKAMQNLTQDFNKGANPQAETPDLKDLEHKSDRLAKDLEGIKDRMEALENARKGLRDDLAKAIQELQREMLNENGKLSDRDLQELRDFIARMREQLKDLQDKQEDLLNNSEKGGDLKDLETKQADLDKQLEKMLDAARKMLNAKRDANRRKPQFPDEPYTADDEVKVPPKEDDTNEPLPNAKKPGDKTDPGDKKPDDMKDDDKEPLDMPALGGPRQVPDKRFDKKRRPTEKKPGDKDDPDAQREDLESHQNDRLSDLDKAQKSLASDQQSLEKMMQSLEQAMKNNGGKPHAPDGQPADPNDDAMRQLADMLQSPAMRQMRDMLGRMRQQGQAKGKPSNQPPPPSQTQSSMAGNQPAVSAADLAKLPPDLREAFLKLPPRLREELLQGQKEQDVEGFAPFIEDYFRRLTQTKNP